MANQTKLLYLIGFWAAIVAFVGAVGYIVSAFLQVFNVVGPLQDSFIGYGTSLLIPVPFLLTMLVLHYIIPAEKKFWTHTAIAFAIIYTTYNTLNYVVQLATHNGDTGRVLLDLRKPAGDGGSTQSSQPDPAFTLLGHGWIGLYFSEFVHPLRVSSLREPRLAKLAEVVLHSERVDYPFVRHRLFLPWLLGSPIVFGITLGDHRPRLHVVTGTVLSKQICNTR